MRTNANHLINVIFIFLAISFILVSCKAQDKEVDEKPFPYTEGTVRIAKWQGNKKAVLNLQFDDSTPGQAALGVPALNSRNLIGTWYINPGREEYEMGKDVWENQAYQGGQELANHTMHHSGASSYQEVVTEVGDAAKVIWAIRGEPENGSLMAFNRGGGTSWNESDLATVLEMFHNIDRLSYTGIKVLAQTIAIGSDADDMMSVIPQVLKDSIVGSIHFHGIAADEGEKDYGNGAVWIEEFEKFADRLVEMKDDLWIAGYIQTYKYIKERQTAKINLPQYSAEKYGVEPTCDMEEKYYNEPLTILVYLPKDWNTAQVTHENTTTDYQMKDGVLQFDARPNKGDITIIKKN